MARAPIPSRLIGPRRAALAVAAPAALAGDLIGVHQARVSSRRLREVLPVVGVGADVRTAARRAVRSVTRALGPVRELDVSLQVYATLTAAAPLGAGADAALRRTVSAARTAAMREARIALAPARLQAVWRALDAVEAAPSASRHAVVTLIDARIARRAAALTDSLAHLGVLYSAERLHAVRIAVKQLRYALEVAGEMRTRATAGDRQALRAVQDLLGRAHDLHVLGGLVRQADARVVARSRAAARDLRRLARDIDRECRRLHAAFLGRCGRLAAMAARIAGHASRPTRRAA